MKIEAKVKPWNEWISYDTTTLSDLNLTSTHHTLNRFNGVSTGAVESTGFFYAKKLEDRWWLVDPDGGLYINAGVAGVRPGHTANNKAALAQKYGSEDAWRKDAVRLLKENGFSSVGCWSVNTSAESFAYTMIWNFMGGYGRATGRTYQKPGHLGYPNDCMPVFDPEFASFCEDMAKELSQTADDPWLLGHFTDNELPLNEDCLDRFLTLPEGDNGRLAAEKWLADRNVTEISKLDRDEFLGYVYETYLRITTTACRKYDKNHMIFGSRLHSKAALNSPVIFHVAGKYLDCIAVNYYHVWTPVREQLSMWEENAHKPCIITEWYTKGEDSGMGNTSGAGWIVRTQDERGLFYQNFCIGLLDTKVCVGWHWFRYMDNDPGDEHADPSNKDSNKGIVNTFYEPYEPLLKRMREFNEKLYSIAGGEVCKS